VHTAASESAFELGIGAGFALAGAWPVLPFAGLEVVALAAAFYLNGRHAADYERIAVSGDKLLVQASDAGRMELHEFDRRWLRIDERRRGRDLRVLLCSSGSELEIGRHLDTEGRASLGWRLRRSLLNR